jgi:ferredoxin
LIANFNLEISSTNLATFVCGSCVENCPVNDKVTLDFEDFDMSLLHRPDEFEASLEDVDMETANHSMPKQIHRPWLDSLCPDPPMPVAGNSPYQNMLIDPSSLEYDPETFEPALAVC